jgi:hypothetical protein
LHLPDIAEPIWAEWPSYLLLFEKEESKQ